MDIKKLESLSKDYKSIEQTHNDIIKLESIVENILKTENGLKLKIECEKQKDNTKNILDSDGSLNNGSVQNIWVTYNLSSSGCTVVENDNVIDFSTELNDLLSLELIGFLISEKRKLIDSILKKHKNVL